MLKIRLQRVGRVHEPSFRLVLTDSKNSSKTGRFKEILGSYDPRKSVDAFKADRIKYWLSQGVGLTGTVNNLLIKNKIIEGKKINVAHIPKKEPQPEALSPEANVAEAPQESTPEPTPEASPEPEAAAPAEESSVA